MSDRKPKYITYIITKHIFSNHQSGLRCMQKRQVQQSAQVYTFGKLAFFETTKPQA